MINNSLFSINILIKQMQCNILGMNKLKTKEYDNEVG
jgi:hypothetical protein